MYQRVIVGRKIKHNYEEVYKRHKEGKTLLQLSKEMNIPISSIYSHFIKMKWKYEDIPICREGFYVNHNYLDDIDTEEKAYFLGWMFSDGYITGKVLGIKVKKEDDYILSQMYKDFGNGHQLYKIENHTQFSLSSQKISERLKELGCVERKTINGFSIPKIERNLIRHFIRGYFDGDGSICRRTHRKKQVQVYICSIDLTFLEELKNLLLDFGINSEIFKETRNGKELKTPQGKILTNCKDMYKVVISSHKDKLLFYEFLYKDSKQKLLRKFELYNEYYVNTVLTLESKNSSAVQRVGDETFINFEVIDDKTFKMGKEVDENKIIEMYNNNIKKFRIHKETGVCRSVIERIIKEYNSPKSARHPKQG